MAILYFALQWLPAKPEHACMGMSPYAAHVHPHPTPCTKHPHGACALIAWLAPPPGLGGILKYQMLPAPDLGVVSKYPASGNWPESYTKEVDPWQRIDFATYR